MFITEDKTAAKILESEKISYNLMSNLSNDELNCINGNIVIVDSYEELPIVKRLWHQGCKIVAIDDLGLNHKYAHMIINGNIYGESIKQSTDKYYLLGPNYNMLKGVYSNGQKSISNTVKEILITTGGADTKNLLSPLINFIALNPKYCDIIFHIPIGAGVINKNGFRELFNKYENLRLYFNCNDLSSIMRSVDLAISSGGSTLYELAASGVPTIAFKVADNQNDLIKTMANHNLIREVDVNQSFVKLVENCLDSVLEDYEWRLKSSSEGLRLFDGNGLIRIVDKIYEIFDEEVRYE